MKLFSKIIKTPTGEEKEVEVVKTWRVDWTVWRGYSEPKKTKYEVFYSKEDANDFYSRLVAAQKLLHDSNVDITPPVEN